MKTINQKLQIMESLNELDQLQTEKVLAYIQGLTKNDSPTTGYDKWKKEAMQEIRLALRNERSFNTAF